MKDWMPLCGQERNDIFVVYAKALSHAKYFRTFPNGRQRVVSCSCYSTFRHNYLLHFDVAVKRKHHL